MKHLGLHHPSSRYPYDSMAYQARHVELQLADMAEIAARLAGNLAESLKP